ncbi:MAG TPA: hypothetical protein VMN43_00840 [Aestuariivirgaceae bacterium]|nr:hypothetical protein [Aestuariivirgaceae bacterium]
MSQAGAKPVAYRRLSGGERQLVESPLLEGLTALRRLLPLGINQFERRLGRAMAEAARRNAGFYLGGFAAQRALAGELWIDIDPAMVDRRIDHRLRHDGRAYNIRERFLGAGDWTPLLRRLERSSTHREVAEIVQAGFDYRATSSYRKGLDRSRGPKPMRRNFVLLSSPAKVEAYFRQTAEMCRSVQQLGILRRSSYGWRPASFATPSVRLPWIEFGEVDIGIAIGPAGELYRFASGKHRTAAAQALKLKSMPVEIRLVHADWLARQMASTGLGPVAALRCGIETLSLTPR